MKIHNAVVTCLDQYCVSCWRCSFIFKGAYDLTVNLFPLFSEALPLTLFWLHLLNVQESFNVLVAVDLFSSGWSSAMSHTFFLSKVTSNEENRNRLHVKKETSWKCIGQEPQPFNSFLMFSTAMSFLCYIWFEKKDGPRSVIVRTRRGKSLVFVTVVAKWTLRDITSQR